MCTSNWRRKDEACIWQPDLPISSGRSNLSEHHRHRLPHYHGPDLQQQVGIAARPSYQLSLRKVLADQRVRHRLDKG
jgi:hypothetical protein